MPRISTQLTDLYTLNCNKIEFGKPQIVNLPGGTMKAKRIYVNIHHSDGTMGSVIFPSGPRFSFGVCSSTFMDKVTRTLPICLHAKEGATESDIRWIDQFESLVNHIKEHLVSIRMQIGRRTLEISDMKELNPIYYKYLKDGTRDPEKGPVFYVKLMEYISKETGDMEIRSMFYDKAGSVNPLDLANKFCDVNVNIKLESIFIGSKISLQFKVYDVFVASVIDTSHIRLVPLQEEKPEGKQEESQSNMGFNSPTFPSLKSGSPEPNTALEYK